MGGQLIVRIRTLSSREIDTIYQQVAYEKASGLYSEAMESWGAVNRYRNYLQLQCLNGEGLCCDLPDGYDRETNPHAEAFWSFSSPDNPRETGLPQIAKYITQEVLNTEMLERVVSVTCNNFNRLVARLEALVDNSDFWQPTGPQS